MVNDLFGLLVDAGSVQSTIDQGSRLAAVKREQLGRVAFDFFFGDLENGFGDLFLVLASFELLPDLFANGIVATLLLEAMCETLYG